MYNLLKLVTLTLFSIIFYNAHAAAAPTIYQAEIPVASRSDQDRNNAVKTALAQVLVKVSGNSQILGTNAALKANLAHADDLVQEFSYATGLKTAVTAPLFLEVRFDPETINKLVRDAGAPVWGQSRPVILVWLANEAPDHPADIVDSSDSTLQITFKNLAVARGLPVIFPTMDASELTKVTALDVINQSVPTLQAAAGRYGSNAILMGHMTQSATGISSQWTLLLGEERWEWTIAGKTPPEVLGTLVNNISDTLAKRFATVQTNPVSSRIIMTVSGLKQQTDLSDVMSYLQQQSSVADVQLKSVNGTEVVLDVKLRNEANVFTQALALGTNLAAVGTGEAQDGTLHYQWKQ
jgi:hypothetical protein